MKVLYGLPGAIILLLLSGCYKAIDLRNDPGQGQKFCQVISLGGVNGGQGLLNVFYNVDGNPIEMIFGTDSAPLPGLDNHFRYDKQGRLTDWLINTVQRNIFPPIITVGGAVVWYRFSYPRKDIIVDSEFAYGDMPLTAPAPPQSSFEGDVRTYRLDESGRVIWDSATYGGINIFNYDRNGNLIRPGITYDNKLDPYRTNSVWMFLHQDYSVNNPLSGNDIVYSNFNNYGLPQEVQSTNGPGYLFLYSFQTMNITYDCNCTTSTPKAL